MRDFERRQYEAGVITTVVIIIIILWIFLILKIRS